MDNVQWKLSSAGPALVVSSGQLFYAKRKPKGLRLEQVMEMIRNDPDRSYYSKVLPRRITLAEAVAHDELDKLGEMRDYHSAIDLIMLHPEREFEALPKTGRELLEKHYRSKPRRVA